MPGSYAHITSAILASKKRLLIRIDGFPREAIDAANLQAKFLELGCISPDYPYLHLLSKDSEAWANEMHRTHTCKAIFVGAELVRTLPPGIARDKCLAWLMGYTAHVIADMCVHPVVELKVGSYDDHKPQHRRCEMHQDVYIFNHMGTTMPDTAKHMRATIFDCGAAEDPECLDPDVKGIWENMLATVYPELFKANRPNLDKWHRKCRSILGRFLPTTSRFVGFARHACDGLGFKYPTPKEVDKGEYIENLIVPAPKGKEKRLHYDQIFDLTIGHIQQVWLNITRFVSGQDANILFRDDEWNLDNGKNLIARGQKLVFWDVA